MSEYIVDAKSICQAFPHGQFEEITRCRDCACFEDAGEFGQWCTQLDFGKKEIEGGFCAWGVRRDA